MRPATALTLLLAMLSTPCQAAIYKWVDEKGVTHYTEQPPPDGKGQEIEPRLPQASKQTTHPPASKPEGSKGANDQPTDQVNGKPKEVLTVSPDQLAEQCQKARQRLQQLESSPRILYRGADGEMIRAPEEERQRMIDEERKRIELYCE